MGGTNTSTNYFDLDNVPNETNDLNGGYVDFFHTFTLSQPTIVSYKLNVFGDDRVDVTINGVPVHQSINQEPGGVPCNNFTIGCVSTTQGTFQNPSVVSNNFQTGPANARVNTTSLPFQTGLNTIAFRVYQQGGTGFGLRYIAEITTVPEPGFYSALTFGFIGLGYAIRRRKLKS